LPGNRRSASGPRLTNKSFLPPDALEFSLPPDALEFSFLLLIHQLTGAVAALGLVLLAHRFSLELNPLAHRAFASVVADRFVYG
jgi:hypothetical protein